MEIIQDEKVYQRNQYGSYQLSALQSYSAVRSMKFTREETKYLALTYLFTTKLCQNRSIPVDGYIFAFVGETILHGDPDDLHSSLFQHPWQPFLQ